MKEQIVTLGIAKLAYDKGFRTDTETVVRIQWTQDCDATTRIPYEPSCFLNGDYFNEYDYDPSEFKSLFSTDKEYSVDIVIPTVN